MKIGICDLLDVRPVARPKIDDGCQPKAISEKHVSCHQENEYYFFFFKFSCIFQLISGCVFKKLPVDSMSYDFGIYDDK